MVNFGITQQKKQELERRMDKCDLLENDIEEKAHAESFTKRDWTSPAKPKYSSVIYGKPPAVQGAKSLDSCFRRNDKGDADILEFMDPQQCWGLKVWIPAFAEMTIGRID